MRLNVDSLTAPHAAAQVWDPIADVQRFERLHTRMFGTRPEKPHVGRYELGERLGQGGAGFVHRGFDPMLRRPVAIKLVPIPANLSTARTDEFMAEAHALAALDHPHLVRVHDAGTCTLLDLELSMCMPTSVSSQRLLYLVMELVEGPLLTQWLEPQRPRREILTAFLTMGEALAAAHAAGIVHRDFKPDNIAFDTQGQPKILDFGLAGRTTEPSDGLVVGTPAYMAPEQHGGQSGGPKVDQFAYCVTLWEALTGVRPYPGPTLDTYREQKLDARIDPSGRALPARLRTALLRGLDPDPQRRWEGLAQLVATVRRLRWQAGAAKTAAGALAIATVAVATTLALSTDRAEEPCIKDPQGTADPIWSDPARDRMAEAFNQRVPHAAPELLGLVERRFVRLEESWTTSYQQACTAEGPRRDEAVACMLAAKSASHGVLHALERRADARAIHVLDLLPEPTECLRGDLAGWQWQAALSRDLMEYRSRLMLGEVETVMLHAQQVLDSTETLPPATTAEWLLVSAIGHVPSDPQQARSFFERALTMGERAGSNRVAVRAMLGLSSVLARVDPQQARLYLELADTRRATLGARGKIALDSAWATYLLRVHGDHEAALRRLRAVIQQLTEIDVPPAIAINGVFQLVALLMRMGRLDEADAEIGRVLERVDRVDAVSPAQKIVAVRGVVGWLRGDLEAASRDLELEPPGPAFFDIPMVLEIHVQTSIDRGFPEDAQRQIGAFVAHGVGDGPHDPTLIARAGLELYRGRFSAASTFPSPQDVPGIDWELELLAASEAAIAGRAEELAAAMAAVQDKAQKQDAHGLRLLSLDAAEVATMAHDLELCTRLLEPVRSGPVPHLRVRGHLLAARAMLAAGRDDLADEPLTTATRELAQYEQPWVLGQIELELLDAVRLARRGDLVAAQRRATHAMERRGSRQSLAVARAASLLIGVEAPELSLLAESWVRQLGREVGADPEMIDWLATGASLVPDRSAPSSNESVDP